jgi:sigma-54 dependent transcriptional regulator, acetoin dehydrogenase operon transcriptional activator AcoR
MGIGPLGGMHVYKLVRGDNEFKLVKDNSNIEPTLVSLKSPVFHDESEAWRHCAPHEKQLWKEFVRTGRISSGKMPPTILDSWRRCFQAEVEYAGGRCWDILSPRQLEMRQDQLLDLAAPILETLHHCVRGFGFVVVLIDHDGYILRSVGDVKALQRAETINFGPGANWSELSVGTNAIGTALAIGHPIQVTGPEHYNDGHHLWTCAATPIHDPDGRVIGCLDISGPRENSGFHILEMTSAAARFIEERLQLDRAHACLLHANRYMSAAFNSVADGLISVDTQGIIRGVNPSAAQFLGKTPGELVGCPAEGVLSMDKPTGLGKTAQGPERKIITIPSSTGDTRCFVMTQPIKDNQGEYGGLLITLSRLNPPVRSVPTSLKQNHVRFGVGDIIGESPVLKGALERALLTAQNSSTVLLLGESGTGKELFAQAIHKESVRGTAPFISINCGAIPRDLIQSELFGYSEGAFTGARKGGRPGKLELADGGTLFLDEVSDMPFDLQVNLLRFLEDKAIFRLGDEKVIHADVRIIAATNKDLQTEVREGRFRHDLYYRLGVVVIEIPPLRKRGDDIRLLAEHYIKRLSIKLGKPVNRVSPQVFTALIGYYWPGNIRELVNVLEQAINFMSRDELLPLHLPARLTTPSKPRLPEKPEGIVPLQTLEKYAIEDALIRFHHNVTRVAQALGIGRNTLYSKMKKYGICLNDRRDEPVGRSIGP